MTGVVGNLSLDDPSEPFTRRSAAYATRRVLRRIREALGDDPVFLPIVLRATPTGTVRRLSDRTEIVIEGFPRSGNTFAMFALRHAAAAAGREVVISSHVHTPSAVKAAVKARFPTLYVVRPPRDAIISLLIAAPHVRFADAIDEWAHHHLEILPYGDRFELASFDEVTTDFGAVTARVNARFGTTLPCYEPSPEHDDEVFALIERNHQELHGGTENVVPRPSALRRAEKEWLATQLDAPALAPHWERAERAYQDLLTLRVPARPAGAPGHD